ncbi:MAG TPA: rRNA maturation RNase YbeY [Candidatus Eisenbacteria bacterium]|nr:rRNA maturation RNase YbeY [Candidatus Eisenbacteria bacterium]
MTVEIVRRGAGKRFRDPQLKAIAADLLALLDQRGKVLAVALIGDREMRRLNRRHRKQDKTTDVLSFPSEERLPEGGVLLGDVIISVEQARRQARQRKRPLEAEIVTLLIHGVLHLLGYDHERSRREARIMGDLERKLLAALCERGRLRV